MFVIVHKAPSLSTLQLLTAVAKNATDVLPAKLNKGISFTSPDFSITFGSTGEVRALQSVQPRPEAVEQFLSRRWKYLRKDMRFHNAVQLLKNVRRFGLVPQELPPLRCARVVGGKVVACFPIEGKSSEDDSEVDVHFLDCAWALPEKWEKVEREISALATLGRPQVKVPAQEGTPEKQKLQLTDCGDCLATTEA